MKKLGMSEEFIVEPDKELKKHCYENLQHSGNNYIFSVNFWLKNEQDLGVTMNGNWIQNEKLIKAWKSKMNQCNGMKIYSVELYK